MVATLIVPGPFPTLISFMLYTTKLLFHTTFVEDLYVSPEFGPVRALNPSLGFSNH